MSVFTPFAVRLLLVSISFGGRIVSYVYGVSTIGNVLGTLVTTFTLVPSFGSRALTMVFAAGDHRLRVVDGGRGPVSAWRRSMKAVAAAIALALLATAAQADPVVIASAAYPEGLLWHGGKLYVTEMGADRVSIIEEGGKTRQFWGNGRLRADPDRALRTVGLHRRLPSRPRAWSRSTANGTTGRRFATRAERHAAAGPQRRHQRRAGRRLFLRRRRSSISRSPPTGRVYHAERHGRDDRGGRQHPLRQRRFNFDPATRTLYLSEHLARRVHALTLDARNHVTARKVLIDFAKVPTARDWIRFPLAGPDGIALRPGPDRGGRIRRGPGPYLRPRRQAPGTR